MKQLQSEMELRNGSVSKHIWIISGRFYAHTKNGIEMKVTIFGRKTRFTAFTCFETKISLTVICKEYFAIRSPFDSVSIGGQFLEACIPQLLLSCMTFHCASNFQQNCHPNLRSSALNISLIDVGTKCHFWILLPETQKESEWCDGITNAASFSHLLHCHFVWRGCCYLSKCRNILFTENKVYSTEEVQRMSGDKCTANENKNWTDRRMQQKSRINKVKWMKFL